MVVVPWVVGMGLSVFWWPLGVWLWCVGWRYARGRVAWLVGLVGAVLGVLAFAAGWSYLPVYDSPETWSLSSALQFGGVLWCSVSLCAMMVGDVASGKMRPV